MKFKSDQILKDIEKISAEVFPEIDPIISKFCKELTDVIVEAIAKQVYSLQKEEITK